MSEETVYPLICSDPSLLKETRIEKFLFFIPFLGWVIAMWVQFGRLGKVRKDLDSQLEQRGEFPCDTWGGDEQRVRLAQAAADVVRKVQGFPNNHLLPDDPWDLLVLEEEGLGFIEVAHELGKRFELDLSKEAGNFVRLSFGEVVDYLAREGATHS